MASRKVSERLTNPGSLPIYHRGPRLELGPLPTFIYFSLSGEESLSQDPYNQPITPLVAEGIRCLSWDLPSHGQGMRNEEAMQRWANAIIGADDDILGSFLNKSIENIRWLQEKDYINSEKVVVGGLSRGALLAFHLAARVKEVSAVVAFAPLLGLPNLEEFHHFNNPAMTYDLAPYIEILATKPSMIFIGNRDTRVGTDISYTFHRNLVERAYDAHLRVPPHSFETFPSIGFKGHGTPKEIFERGANWVLMRLS